MKMLLIQSCDDGKKWYADKIGKLVPYLEDSSKHEYKSLQDDGLVPGHRFVNFVSKHDAEIIEVSDEN